MSFRVHDILIVVTILPFLLPVLTNIYPMEHEESVGPRPEVDIPEFFGRLNLSVLAVVMSMKMSCAETDFFNSCWNKA